MVKIVCISDTHGYHRSADIPKCDLLLHTGDFSGRGEEYIVEDLNTWFGELKNKGTVQEIVCIAGNHELSFDPKKIDYSEDIRNILIDSEYCTYLEQDSVELFGFKIYGAPHQPEFCSWGFNEKRGEDLEKIWAKIPDDTNILLTHGPCYDIGDFIPNSWAWQDGMPVDMDDVRRVGCEDLLARVKQLKDLKLHVFGHIHCAHGIYDIDEDKFPFDSVSATESKAMGTLFINASICTEAYNPSNPPLVIDLPGDDA